MERDHLQPNREGMAAENTTIPALYAGLMIDKQGSKSDRDNCTSRIGNQRQLRMKWIWADLCGACGVAG